MSDEWITPKDAGEIIGVTAHQVRKLIRQGTIEAKRFGGWTWMVNRQSAIEYAKTDRRPGPKTDS